jgi:hypothetical protein
LSQIELFIGDRHYVGWELGRKKGSTLLTVYTVQLHAAVRVRFEKALEWVAVWAGGGGGG